MVYHSTQSHLNEMEFNAMAKLVGKLGNQEARLWYKAHDERIPELIDKTKSLEEQARQAHLLRNTYRTQTRDLMRDQEERKRLDEKKPNRTFDEMMEYKKGKYGLTGDDAYRDIVRSSTTTNKKYDESAGIRDDD